MTRLMQFRFNGNSTLKGISSVILASAHKKDKHDIFHDKSPNMQLPAPVAFTILFHATIINGYLVTSFIFRDLNLSSILGNRFSISAKSKGSNFCVLP